MWCHSFKMNSLLPIVKLIFGDNNFGVTKIKNTTYESVYACESVSMLRKDKFYMFVIGEIDIISIGSNVRIEDINNISCIQFRTFTEPILQKVIKQKVEFEPIANDISIKRYNISKDDKGKVSEYMFEYNNKPYNVNIFHTTDSEFEYVNEGTLYSSLITWNTMIINSITVASKPTTYQEQAPSEIPPERTMGQQRPRRQQQIPPLDQPYLTEQGPPPRRQPPDRQQPYMTRAGSGSARQQRPMPPPVQQYSAGGTQQSVVRDEQSELASYGRRPTVPKNPNPTASVHEQPQMPSQVRPTYSQYTANRK